MSTTTGTPQQKYAASDAPDLVDGAYSSHQHNIIFNTTTKGTVREILTYASSVDAVARLSAQNIGDVDNPSKILCTDGLYFGVTDFVTPTKYHENLGNIIPTSAMRGQARVDIVTHDLHVLVERYPPMESDASEQEVSIARIVGSIEIDTHGRVGDTDSQQNIHLEFEPFNAGTTYNGPSALLMTHAYMVDNEHWEFSLNIEPTTGSITDGWIHYPDHMTPTSGTTTFTFV